MRAISEHNPPST